MLGMPRVNLFASYPAVLVGSPARADNPDRFRIATSPEREATISRCPSAVGPIARIALRRECYSSGPSSASGSSKTVTAS